MFNDTHSKTIIVIVEFSLAVEQRRAEAIKALLEIIDRWIDRFIVQTLNNKTISCEPLVQYKNQ